MSLAHLSTVLRRHTAALLTSLVVGLGCAVALSATVFLSTLHGRAVSDAENALTAFSTMLADQADRAFQAIELVQGAIVDEMNAAGVASPEQYARFASRHAFHLDLHARVAALPQVNAITLIDATGTLLNFSRYWPIPTVNIADRDYFMALSARPSLRRYVSQPVQNRGDGAWTIYLARVVTAPDGRFLGLILGAIELGYFERLYRQITPAEDAVISLFRSDGMMLVRHPRLDGVTGRVFPTAGASVIAPKRAAGGVLRVISPLDGRDRLVSARGLADFPMMLSASRTSEAILAPWRQQLTTVGSAVAVFELALFGLLWGGLRSARSQRALIHADAARMAAEERERGERHLRDQHARFGIALDNMTQGLCLFDRDDALIVMNSRFADMHAIPSELRAAGTPLRLLVHILARCQHAADVSLAAPLLKTARLATYEGGTLAAVHDLHDGRAIAVVHAVTPDGGWVCTHEDVTERRRHEARIAYLASHDSLTGLPNRDLLTRILSETLARVGTGTVVLYLDLDGFKAVNDTYGHPAGDELLRAVAGRLGTTVGADGLVGRLGGDEFSVVPAESQSVERANALARRIIAAFQDPFALLGHQVVVGTSIGIARALDHETATATMLRQADVALYQAKAAGRGTWRFFDPGMDAEIQRRRQLGADLRQAIANQGLSVHYQPLVGAGDLELRGFEALARWCHPEHGFISPAEFIPIAEETGQIQALGAWVLLQACTEAASWPRHLRVAVNLSPVQFQAGDLTEVVVGALGHSGLEAARLEVEITESVLLQAHATTRMTLDHLRALGIRIAMDDFGTGFASLSYLRRFPFDKIKIDQSFVRDLGRAPGSLEIVRAIAALGRALNLIVLAEGVETPAQLEILREEGCDEVQGYLFSKPLTPSAARDLIRLPGLSDAA